MCGKMGDNEVDSMQNMMSMAVYFVIADTFDLDVEELTATSRLEDDLGMTDALKAQLDHSIMDMFNNFHVDFSRAETVGDIVGQVAQVRLH